MTVRHLLGHRAGPDQHAFTARLLARHRRLRFDPGDRARYSNLGYPVLGEVVAALSGRRFERFVGDRIPSTLDMRHTGLVYPPDLPPATGYQPVPAPLMPLLRLALPAAIVADGTGMTSPTIRSWSRARPSAASLGTWPTPPGWS